MQLKQSIASKLAKKKKKKSLDKHFCFRFRLGTIMLIFSFIVMDRGGRQYKDETSIKRRDKKAIIIVIRFDDHR